ncbi:uncharacterized protein LOC142345978 isoform X2 [Convolutriloba macropyga]|uniref:uncharacterized protein LOC142345978 isoform X2 n=1 Tax=Convolutriloba macropyga TaxID=536237 RepID=UPI003F51AC88
MDNRPSSNGTYGATSSRNTRIDAAIDRAQTEAHAATSAVRDTLGKFKDRDDKLRDLQQRTANNVCGSDCERYNCGNIYRNYCLFLHQMKLYFV